MITTREWTLDGSSTTNQTQWLLWSPSLFLARKAIWRRNRVKHNGQTRNETCCEKQIDGEKEKNGSKKVLCEVSRLLFCVQKTTCAHAEKEKHA